MTKEKGYALRLPPDLKDKLERLAKINRRSLNGEIIWRLEQSVTLSVQAPSGREDHSQAHQPEP